MTEAKTRSKKTASTVPDELFADFPLANIVLREENVRSDYTNMEEMVASIKAQGVIQAITLGRIRSDDGKVSDKATLIAG